MGFLATPQSERIIEYVRVEYHVGTEFERALCEESRVTLDVTIDWNLGIPIKDEPNNPFLSSMYRHSILTEENIFVEVGGSLRISM